MQHLRSPLPQEHCILPCHPTLLTGRPLLIIRVLESPSEFSGAASMSGMG